MFGEKQGGVGGKQGFAVLLIVAAVGIVFLMLGGSFDDEKREKEASLSVNEARDADEYAQMLEDRIRELCANVKGAGEVSVLVSLKGGYRTVYAMDSQSSTSGHKNEIVLEGSGADKSAVITAYQNPEIAGVGIVCSGGDDAYVRGQIISLVAAALDVSSNKIFVAAS